MHSSDQLQPRGGKRFNWRLAIFIAAVGLPLGSAFYVFADQFFSRGIHDRGSYVAVDLKSLGQFPFDDQLGVLADVPRDFRALDGRRVELEGRAFSRSGALIAREFEFVYDVNKCCFGGPPKVQERVYVHSSKPIVLSGHECRLVGTLHVRLNRNELGTVLSVYDLDLESLRTLTN